MFGAVDRYSSGLDYGGSGGGGGDGGIRLYSLMAGWPRESINSQQVINFHVLIVSRISRRSVYFENDFRSNLEYI